MDYSAELDAWCENNGYHYRYSLNMLEEIDNCTLRIWNKTDRSDKYSVLLAQGKSEEEAKQEAAKICLKLIADGIRYQPGFEFLNYGDLVRDKNEWRKEVEAEATKSYWSWCNII